MAVVGPSIPEYEYYPDAPPSLIGTLTTSLTVHIEVWKDGAGVPLTPAASGCAEIGNTGKYVFSTAHLPALLRSREQYHFRMSDGGANSDEGDFILVAPQISAMPSIGDRGSYIATP